MRLMHLGRLSLALWHLRQLLLGRHYHAARSLPEAIRDSRQGWCRLYRLVQALSEAKLGEYYEVAWQERGRCSLAAVASTENCNPP